ncbi:hypothetical protein [Caproiciproducens galactitolivorans]|uniref:Uncharacterized protein n=1 Tax=Caproiciproducens galactitolivorans TaxID=642589 RepID=A0ABT4BQZ1_9FIRM|nr:hypothetical protein [Caproiciproducens galactitolivorans]MCY1713314.1 hypothetical protein [Caproiciproducens galactitolivorans]
MKKKIGFGIFFIAVLLFAGIIGFHNYSANNEINSNDEGLIHLENYQKDTRERFIAGLALQKKLIYEQADALEKEETASMGSQSPDREIRYKTIDKLAGSIKGSGYSQEVYIKTEVKYVWDTAKNELVSIESFALPVTYLPGVSASAVTLNGSAFNIEKGSTSRRMSQTATFAIVEKENIPVGDDIVSIRKAAGGYEISTRAKTYAIHITASDL